MKRRLLLAGFATACARTKTAAGETVPHPSDRSKSVEFFVRRPEGAGPWPAIIYLHGHQPPGGAGGRVFLDWGVLDRAAKRDYVGVSVSAPGLGASSGPPDFCGPFTQDAVLAVVKHLRTQPYVAPKIALLGVSRGANVAALVASRDESITALVLISGAYDLVALRARLEAGGGPSDGKTLLKGMLAESGDSPDALKDRSPLFVADRIKARTLILHGSKDDRSDPEDAKKFAELTGAKLVLYPEHGHAIPPELREETIDAFLRETL